MTFVLPDDVLLEIFDFYMNEYEDMDERFYHSMKQVEEKWITLAHVCRRWRSVVFQSSHRLNLRLNCTPSTPARDTLDIWPPLPLIIYGSDHFFDDELVDYTFDDFDNIIAALKHNNHVCRIDLGSIASSQLEYVADSAAMYKPFPELTDLDLTTWDDDGPVLPDSFLGGTAPRLRYLRLSHVPFPGLPKLLLSATHLVNLDLSSIPPSGYIRPEAMATSLSALISLEFIRLDFRCPRPRPALESRRPLPPPLTRPILPSLTEILFQGASEYSEEFLARIDAPRLKKMHITFFNEIVFDTPQLLQFISRTPTLRAQEQGHIVFSHRESVVKFRSQTSDNGELFVQIRCTASDWQVSSVEQVCTSSLPPVLMLEDLYISEDPKYPPHWQDNVENALWLELLHPFAAVKNLYLCKKFMSRIAPALEELVGGRTTEVLSTLENIYLEGFQPSGPLHEGIEKFVAARRLTSHPVAVSRWDGEGKWGIYI